MADKEKAAVATVATLTEEAAKKKSAPKKAASKPAPTRYVVAEGKALSVAGRIEGPGDEIKADQVADIEALIKGGYVVKA